eukprot:TRINITY_DN882_c0_g1_i1.p1 TRINITY_DN882_c0_g1~~TRINITY_DN882_c0_g1_i1.p1  ORF type:complete len:145 (+),score=21.82 TRINITY_DN882_c0_g1_i1:219-653(+)
MFSVNDNQKIGILLTTFGVFFTLFGVLLFFDRGLLAIGNLLFLAGITMVIGLRKTGAFFFQRRKLKGTICFLLGIAMVLFGWTFFGMVIEVFGFINLFGDFFPDLLRFLRRIPILGTFLNLPVVQQLIDAIMRFTGTSDARLPV